MDRHNPNTDRDSRSTSARYASRSPASTASTIWRSWAPLVANEVVVLPPRDRRAEIVLVRKMRGNGHVSYGPRPKVPPNIQVVDTSTARNETSQKAGRSCDRPAFRSPVWDQVLPLGVEHEHESCR